MDRPPLFPTLILFCLLLCGSTRAQQRIPPPVEGWRCTSDSVVYVPDNVWDFIDGAAELYLAYGFVNLHVADYFDADSLDVRVEWYRHDSAEDAFGIYAQERKPEYYFLSIGTQGYLEEDVLNFLCGTYYVKMSASASGEKARESLEALARELASSLHQTAGWPEALALFPPRARLANCERYVARDFLGYSFFRSASVASYDSLCRYSLFLIPLDSASQATSLLSTYQKSLGSSLAMGEGVVNNVLDPHNGEILLCREGRYLAGATGCIAAGKARQTLEELTRGLRRSAGRH